MHPPRPRKSRADGGGIEYLPRTHTTQILAEMHFDSTITIGSVIQLTSGIVMVVSVYWSTRMQITKIMQRMNEIEKRQDRQERDAIRTEADNKKEIAALAVEIRTSTSATHSRLDNILHAIAFGVNKEAP